LRQPKKDLNHEKTSSYIRYPKPLPAPTHDHSGACDATTATHPDIGLGSDHRWSPQRVGFSAPSGAARIDRRDKRSVGGKAGINK
jgi:hypothetical protein